MLNILLLGTSACHLCELAEQICIELQSINSHINIEKIDIAEQVQWQIGFATKIPVLYNPKTQNELDWPFDYCQATTYIEKEQVND